jgi:hypothetical protein
MTMGKRYQVMLAKRPSKAEGSRSVAWRRREQFFKFNAITRQAQNLLPSTDEYFQTPHTRHS